MSKPGKKLRAAMQWREQYRLRKACPIMWKTGIRDPVAYARVVERVKAAYRLFGLEYE